MSVFKTRVFGHLRAEIITKQLLGILCFPVIFVTITIIVPPEDLLCSVAVTGVSLFAREHAKEFTL